MRKEGPGGLYWGFLPHCFEALPHDMSEMLVRVASDVSGGRGASMLSSPLMACEHPEHCPGGPPYVVVASCLQVMGCMKDAHADGLVPGSRNHWWMQHVPIEVRDWHRSHPGMVAALSRVPGICDLFAVDAAWQVWDLAAGAASGAAAVLVSQPLDTIKTFLQVTDWLPGPPTPGCVLHQQQDAGILVTMGRALIHAAHSPPVPCPHADTLG